MDHFEQLTEAARTKTLTAQFLSEKCGIINGSGQSLGAMWILRNIRIFIGTGIDIGAFFMSNANNFPFVLTVTQTPVLLNLLPPEKRREFLASIEKMIGGNGSVTINEKADIPQTQSTQPLFPRGNNEPRPRRQRKTEPLTKDDVVPVVPVKEVGSVPEEDIALNDIPSIIEEAPITLIVTTSPPPVRQYKTVARKEEDLLAIPIDEVDDHKDEEETVHPSIRKSRRTNYHEVTLTPENVLDVCVSTSNAEIVDIDLSEEFVGSIPLKDRVVLCSKLSHNLHGGDGAVHLVLSTYLDTPADKKVKFFDELCEKKIIARVGMMRFIQRLWLKGAVPKLLDQKMRKEASFYGFLLGQLSFQDLGSQSVLGLCGPHFIGVLPESQLRERILSVGDYVIMDPLRHRHSVAKNVFAAYATLVVTKEKYETGLV